MKTSRAALIWATLALCGVVVLGAMSWMTRGVLASERERAGAEARADLEERTRLALWRMDAVGGALLLAESQIPPSEFNVRVPETNPLVHLHFEVRAGGLSSPEADDSDSRLRSLRELLSENGDIGTILNCAAEAGEKAWQAVPKDAGELKSRMSDSYGASAAMKRASPSYQADTNRFEKVQRAKAVESQEASAAALNKSLAGLSNALEGPDEILEIGSVRAVWIRRELFLIRNVTVRAPTGPAQVIQGTWMNGEKVREHLLAPVSDLLPAATLEPVVANGPAYPVRAESSLDFQSSIAKADDPLALVSFPFRLERHADLQLAALPWSKPLIVGWAAVLTALLTASFLVHGVMKLSERRASFVSAVTHELRTPLTTFRLYSDMLESGAVKPEKRGDYLRVLSREADRLAHLVENVLSFSKVERGSARSVVRETTIADLLEPMRERLGARLATANLILKMDLKCDSKVRVDAAAVEHILFNLIDNAAKYAASGDPPEVEIRVTVSGRFAEVVVIDSGPGIPTNERRRIFRAFHKSAREAAESRPGVGLGLALSRRLARSLGGGLECVDSKQGACFVLSLPLA